MRRYEDLRSRLMFFIKIMAFVLASFALMGIDHIRFYFSGDNLAEWSGLYKYYRVDPEGLGGQMYPFQRSYSLGINVTF